MKHRAQIYDLDSVRHRQPQDESLASVTELEVRPRWSRTRTAATVALAAVTAAVAIPMVAEAVGGSDDAPAPVLAPDYDVDCSDETQVFVPSAGEGYLDAAYSVDIQVAEGMDEYTGVKEVASYLRETAETPAIYADRSYEFPVDCVVSIHQ